MQKTNNLPLHEWHKHYNAHFTEVNGWNIPEKYGDIDAEINTAKNSVVLLDQSYLGKVLLQGNDAFQLLNQTSTNDMNKLLTGLVCDTVFTTPQGKLVDYCRVLNLQPEFLLISSCADKNHFLNWINRFIITENATAEDVSADFVWFTILGPASADLLYMLSVEEMTPADDAVWLNYKGEDFPALRNDNFIVPAYNICLQAKGSEQIINWLAEKIFVSGGSLIGNNAFQVVRMDSGLPEWGLELSEEYNIFEARLSNAISFTKEPFTGQEALASLDTADLVQRYLMIIDFKGNIQEEAPPLNVFYDDEPIGLVTSYIYDPLKGRHVGLGYIKKMYALRNYNFTVEVQTGQGRIPASLRLPPER